MIFKPSAFDLLLIKLLRHAHSHVSLWPYLPSDSGYNINYKTTFSELFTCFDIVHKHDAARRLGSAYT